MNKFILYVVVLLIACASSVYANDKANYKKGNKAFMEGNEKFRNEDYAGAIAKYTEAIEWIADFEGAYFNRGLVYFFLGKQAQIYSDYDTAGQLMRSKKADAYKIRNDYLKAIKDFTKAIEIDSHFVDAYLQRGAVYEKLGKDAKAQTDLQHAEKLQLESTE